MSVLPIGRRLQQVIPDLDDLLLDPARYLSSGLSIGARRMYGMAALFAVGGLGFLLSLLFMDLKKDEAWVPERIALGVGMQAGALFFLSWSLMLRGHQLVLHPEGVEVKYRRTTVWCPWSLFNTNGAVYVPESDSPLVGLSLPVAVEAIPYVELRREDTPIAHGAEIKSRQFLFTPDGRVVLTGRYEVVAAELGALLLQLGSRLGRQLPRGEPPPEAYRFQDIAAANSPEPDEAGWITVHLTRLHWPPFCCECGADTSHALHVPLQTGADRVFRLVGSSPRQLEVELPVCESCHDQIKTRQERGGRAGMLLGSLLLPAVAAMLYLSGLPLPLDLLVLVALMAMPIGSLIGFGIGTALMRRLPVQFRNYSPSHGTISLRFRDRDRAGPLLAALRERDTMRH